MIPLLCLVFMWFASSFAATMISEAMALVPGNEKFGERLEYATVLRHYFGARSYMATQVSTNQSINRINQSINQSINQPIYKSINQSIESIESINQ